MALRVKIFVSHINIHQRAYCSEEALNNQVNKTTWAADLSQSLSLATPVMARWAHEHSAHGSRHGSYTWLQQHGLLLMKADLANATAECSMCHIWHYSLRPTGHLVASSQHYVPSILKGPMGHSHRNRHIFQVWASLFCLRVFSQQLLSRDLWDAM